MSEASLKHVVVSGANWSLLSLLVRRILSLALIALLARLLVPADFGLIAMVGVVTGLFDFVRDLGMGAAIVQRKELKDEFLTTLFWLTAIVGLLSTTVLILASVRVAWFYGDERIVPLLRGLSAAGLFASLGIVPSALLTRRLQFALIAKIEIVTTSIQIVTTALVGLAGFGVWTLVYQAIAGAIFLTAGSWLVAGWRPTLSVDLREMRSVLKFSLSLTGFNLLNYLMRSADNALIGRYLGALQLGYYDLAYRVMLYPVQMLSWTLIRVLFPIYTRMGDDLERLRKAYLKVAGAIALVSFPIMLGISVVAEPFVAAVFGSEWSMAAKVAAILAPVGALQSIMATVGSIYQARGRTDLLMRWGIGSSIVILSSFVIGLRWGIMGVALSYAVAMVLITYHCFAVPFKLIGLRLSELWRAVKRPLACSLTMFLATWAVHGCVGNTLGSGLTLLLLIGVGGVTYGSLTWAINRESFLDLLAAITLRRTLGDAV